jgi:hypothetical protein
MNAATVLFDCPSGMEPQPRVVLQVHHRAHRPQFDGVISDLYTGYNRWPITYNACARGDELTMTNSYNGHTDLLSRIDASGVCRGVSVVYFDNLAGFQESDRRSIH